MYVQICIVYLAMLDRVPDFITAVQHFCKYTDSLTFTATDIYSRPVFDSINDTFDALHERSPFAVDCICMVAARVRDGGGTY